MEANPALPAPCRSLPRTAAWHCAPRSPSAVRPAAAAWLCAPRAASWPRCGSRRCCGPDCRRRGGWGSQAAARSPAAAASQPARRVPGPAKPPTSARHRPTSAGCAAARAGLQVERVAKAGGLYQNFTSSQALGYLDGTLPGGALAAPPAAGAAGQQLERWQLVRHSHGSAAGCCARQPPATAMGSRFRWHIARPHRPAAAAASSPRQLLSLSSCRCRRLGPAPSACPSSRPAIHPLPLPPPACLPARRLWL